MNDDVNVAPIFSGENEMKNLDGTDIVQKGNQEQSLEQLIKKDG